MPYPARILFLARSLNYGGSERQLVALAIGLHQEGQSVAVATFYPGGPFQHSLESAGVSVSSLGKHSRWGLVGFVWRLIRLVRRVRPKILHGYLGTSNILAVCLKPFCPGMKVIWGVRASNMELERYGWLDRLLYWIECRLSQCADVIIVNSHVGLDYAVSHGFPREKMVVIANGIDTERFYPDRHARARVREMWGIRAEAYLIGLVGRLDPMKGHMTFVRAAAVLMTQRPDVRFVCVGDGPELYQRRLVALTEELGLKDRLHWVPASENIASLYNAFDIATSASYYGEGFSNAIGEAMACGIPCVVTDVGDGKLIVGETGSVVAAGDPKALALAWKNMLEMGPAERERQGQCARARIVQNFSLARLIKSTSQVFNAVEPLRQ